MNAESSNPFEISIKLREYRDRNIRIAKRNPCEIIARRILKRKGVLFKPQTVFRQRIFDFFVMEKGIAIEVDGDSHDEEWDKKRDAYLFDMDGVIVLRVKNWDVEGVHEIIKAVRLSKRWPDRLKELGRPVPEWLKNQMPNVKARKSKQTKRIRAKLRALWKSDGKNLPNRKRRYYLRA